MNTQSKRNLRRRIRRKGAATVEFALVVPVMLTFTFGLIEMSRLNMVQESITQATRSGARVGVRPNATAADVQSRVDEELAILGIENAIVAITPTPLGTATGEDTVSVQITVRISDVSYVPGYFDFERMNLSALTVMRRESTN